jgi:uncharacterized protein DUF4440
MPNDKEVLTQLNIQIGEAETRGDRQWLGDVIALKFAFRRADRKTIDDRTDFLKKVTASEPRDTSIDLIDIHGDRAIVRCTVTVQSATGEKRYDNIRLFVRHEGKWRLLGWANEPM